MGCTPPAAFCAKVGVSITYEQKASVEEVSTIRLDIAKSANGLVRVARTAAGQRLLCCRIRKVRFWAEYRNSCHSSLNALNRRLRLHGIDLDARSDLYRQLAERIWNPADLLTKAQDKADE